MLPLEEVVQRFPSAEFRTAAFIRFNCELKLLQSSEVPRYIHNVATMPAAAMTAARVTNVTHRLWSTTTVVAIGIGDTVDGGPLFSITLLHSVTTLLSAKTKSMSSRQTGRR